MNEEEDKKICLSVKIAASVSGSSGSSGSCGSGDEEGNGTGMEKTDTGENDSKGCVAVSSYRDFSHVPPDPTNLEKADNNVTLSMLYLKSTKGPAVKEATFPVKLHMILSNPALENIISWLPHGRSWRITQQKEFTTKVIPLYFRHSSFSSFTRQVSGWAFSRIFSGADFNSHYHELFLRGMPHLCHKMKRLVATDMIERKARKESGYVELRPDFYALDRAHALPLNDEKPSAHLLPDKALEATGISPGMTMSSVSSSALTGVPGAAEAQSELTLVELRLRHAQIVSRMNQVKANYLNPAGQAQATNALQLLRTMNGTLGAENNVSNLPSLLNSTAPGQATTAQQILAALSTGASTTSLGSISNAQASGLAPFLGSQQSQGPTQSSSTLYHLGLTLASANQGSSSQQQQQAPAPIVSSGAQDSTYETLRRNLRLAQLLQGQPQSRQQDHQGFVSNQQQQQASFPGATSGSHGATGQGLQSNILSLFLQYQQQQQYQQPTPQPPISQPMGNLAALLLLSRQQNNN